MNVTEISMKVPPAGDTTGQSVSVNTSSAATANPIGAKSAVIYSTVECFAVYGAAPTATVAAGIPIPAGIPVRVYGFDATDKLAFIAASGSGVAYVRPAA